MRAPDLRRELALLSRFGGAGVLTTALGGAIILGLDVGLGVNRQIANAAGYLVGAGVGLFLQSRFVFRQQNAGRAYVLRFAAVLALAFAVNQAVLRTAGLLLPPTQFGHAAAQILAMATYTATQFALFRLWVFRPAR